MALAEKKLPGEAAVELLKDLERSEGRLLPFRVRP